ncbi:type II secretion system minor pseudopilin GspI [Pseudomonas sp. SDO55104_S430]
MARRRMGGFTLLEIMVALTVFATLATAVLSASQYVLRQASTVEERLIAAWVADNQLNELRLQNEPDFGQSQRVVNMDRRDWIVRQQVGSSSEAGLIAIELQVSLAGRDQTLHRATGWIPQREQ